MKKLIYTILILQIFIIPLYGNSAVKYYKQRKLIRKTLSWDYSGEINKSKAEKLPVYYKVTYKKKDIVRVEYPYYSSAGMAIDPETGRPITGKSVEIYKDGKIQERRNIVGVKLQNFFKYIYNKEGQLRKEEFHKRREYTKFDGPNNEPQTVTQTKLIYTFIYYYRKGVLSKRACYDKTHNQPVGKWEFYDSNGKIIKIIQYRLVPSGDKMKGQKESIIKLTRDKSGNVIREERFDGENYPLVKLYFNDKGAQVRRDDYFDKKLIRRINNFYRADGSLKRSELWEGGAKIQEIIYGNDGKTVLELVYYDSKGKAIKKKQNNKKK